MSGAMDAIAKGCGPHCGHWNDMQELDRLRTLITAWADADDAYNALWAPRGTRTQAKVHDAERAVDAALTALRKAVGR